MAPTTPQERDLISPTKEQAFQVLMAAHTRLSEQLSRHGGAELELDPGLLVAPWLGALALGEQFSADGVESLWQDDIRTRRQYAGFLRSIALASGLTRLELRLLGVHPAWAGYLTRSPAGPVARSADGHGRFPVWGTMMLVARMASRLAQDGSAPRDGASGQHPFWHFSSLVTQLGRLDQAARGSLDALAPNRWQALFALLAKVGTIGRAPVHPKEPAYLFNHGNQPNRREFDKICLAWRQTG